MSVAYLALTIVFGIAVWQAGLRLTRPARLLAVEPKIVDLGDVLPGKQYTAAFIVTNADRHDQTLIGASTGCGCLVSSDLPLRLPAGESRTVEFQLHIDAGQPAARLQYPVRVLADQAGWSESFEIAASVVGHVPSTSTTSAGETVP